jgi:hypothetical protein
LSTLLQPRPQSTSAFSIVLDELDVYLKEPLVTNETGEFDLSFSPVRERTKKENKLPTLASMERDH